MFKIIILIKTRNPHLLRELIQLQQYNHAVKNLKKIIYQYFLIKIEDQRLIFENSELDDSQILSESELISNSSIVYVDDTSIVHDLGI